MTTSKKIGELWKRAAGLEDVIEMVVEYLSDETPIYEGDEPIEEAQQARDRVNGAALLLRDALGDYTVMISDMHSGVCAEEEAERRKRQAETTTTEATAN